MNDNGTTLKIDDIEFELDINDADDMERYENAFRNMTKAHDEFVKENDDTKLAEQIRRTCTIYRKLVDDLFGEGTSEKMPSMKKNNARNHEEIVEQIIDFVTKQKAIDAARRDKFRNKYKPAGRSENV